MEFILTAIFFTIAIVIGITIATQKGMFAYNLRKNAEDNGSVYLEPLILCHWCMPSVYSLFGYVFAYILLGWDIKYLLFYIPVVGISSLICGVIWGLVVILNYNTKEIKDYEKSIEEHGDKANNK